HTGLENSPLTGGPVSSDFFPESRVYNWPNPVYDSKTTIRYFVGQDASVSVKIFDLTGDIVDEFSGPGVGGVDNEVEWDVSNIQSGIYFARIKATDGSKSASALIKIAVVK
ncbi:MAG TPA: T9SS type A sorting domain-containing protein, partial [Bacteroidota bacterium]